MCVCVLYFMLLFKHMTRALRFLKSPSYNSSCSVPLPRTLFLFDGIALCSCGLQIPKRWRQNCFSFSPSLTHIHANVHTSPQPPSFRSTRIKLIYSIYRRCSLDFSRNIAHACHRSICLLPKNKKAQCEICMTKKNEQCQVKERTDKIETNFSIRGTSKNVKNFREI